MVEGPELVDEFRNRLRAAGASVRPGVPETTLASFEQLHRTGIPSDMRAFYLGVDGMEDEFPFESMVRILPIDEVVPVRREFPGQHPDDAFVIGDGFISAYFYAVDLAGTAGPSGAVYLVGARPEQVASSFSEFINHVLNDSAQLIPSDGFV